MDAPIMGPDLSTEHPRENRAPVPGMASAKVAQQAERVRPYELAVVIPTLNERENIVLLLAKLRDVLRGISYEVIVVDDDSPDGTAAVVRRLAQSQDNLHVLHRIGRRGLSSACIEGMLATSAPFVAVMDADLQHDETILPQMYRLIAGQQLDVVVGSRNIAGGSMGEFADWRVKLSRAGRKLSGLGAQSSFTDPMSGFFVVRRPFFDSIAHHLTGKGFKILLDIVLSSKGKAKIGEVPYRFRLRQHGQSKLDIMVGLEYLELLVDKVVGAYVSVRFVLFCLIGAAGLALDVLLLWLLLTTHRTSFLEAQGIATAVVMVCNYVLNNTITYRDRRRHGLGFWYGLLKFLVACSLGAVSNLAIASEAYQHGIPWVLAGIIGLLFSAVWNFGVTSALIWRHGKQSVASRASRRAAAEEILVGEMLTSSEDEAIAVNGQEAAVQGQR